MNLHKEISFEAEICEHLASQGWLDGAADAADYDRPRALFPADLAAWVQASQPKAWEALARSHGASTEAMLLDRLRKQIDERGTLDVLRHGIELIGLKAPLAMAQFKPALTMNPDILTRYEANRLRVMRQVRYSTANQNSIDLVLFLNGLPVATVELKTDFTQSVTDAVDQYRFDRVPNPKGQSPETLLSFPNGALVHFAVSNAEVMMATKLEGTSTRFLPFNRGDGGGKGNPSNPNGHPTSYLWEDIWQRDSWLEIIGRYMVAVRDAKKQITSVVFPRFHQLDATRKLRSAVLEDGPGGKYLIQHSAGSGKANSIAWSAHFLADLHNDKHEKVFDTVLVVSDRNVIDTQLQEAIFGFERQAGVVASIKNQGGAKSGQLADALAGGKKIVVCTIQTFPFALKAVRELSASEGKKFAVIADEAHSSQTGEAAAKLKEVLSAEEIKELSDGGEISTEDLLTAQMASRASDAGITYVAFTATPKGKTLELFGRVPDPSQPAGPTNVPEAFHVYSMRQAIEEGFILDILKNYTPYGLAFKLASEGKELDETEVERSAAMKGLMRWVRLHPYNISQKVQVVVEHFRSLIQPLLDGKGKAMVVVGSRVEAVRWQLAIEKYIKENGYPLGTLVAFSGEVSDPDSGPDPFTETSKELNPGLKGRDIREAFKLPIIISFSSPINSRPASISHCYAACTWIAGWPAFRQSRRCLVSTERIRARTRPTSSTSSTAPTTSSLPSRPTTRRRRLRRPRDPNLVYDLRAKLDGAGYYDEFEVDRVAKAELNPSSKQSDLVAAVRPVADRLMHAYKDAQSRLRAAKARDDQKAATEAKDGMDALLLFRNDMGAYLRLYSFLSQIFDYGNSAIEARSIFYRRLTPLLKFESERAEIDTSQIMMTHHKLTTQGKRTLAPRRRRSETAANLGDRVRLGAGEGESTARRNSRSGERSLPRRRHRR